ncbi:hypothetical protein WJX84_010300 [Apatococcus fuscideae]|uniref:Uncharacterized protein n=1 Tax=Apatococcus fuscideae TaxID=2026836 RepID=A0AAW1THX1_9CHLO
MRPQPKVRKAKDCQLKATVADAGASAAADSHQLAHHSQAMPKLAAGEFASKSPPASPTRDAVPPFKAQAGIQGPVIQQHLPGSIPADVLALSKPVANGRHPQSLVPVQYPPASAVAAQPPIEVSAAAQRSNRGKLAGLPQLRASAVSSTAGENLAAAEELLESSLHPGSSGADLQAAIRMAVRTIASVDPSVFDLTQLRRKLLAFPMPELRLLANLAPTDPK